MLRDPGDRTPAPAPLRLVQAFVNTLDIENDVEELTEPETLHGTLVRLGVLDPDEGSLTVADLRTGLEAREALRELALANNGVPIGREALRTLERIAQRADLTLLLGADGHAHLAARAPGIDGALGSILAVVHESMTAGTWWRLKGCPRDVCHWLFYDRSRNGSGKWCAMSVCGNRTNTKAYRRRAAA
jgi:CGNR zinc finger protein/putative stress-induced transcription regulator